MGIILFFDDWKIQNRDNMTRRLGKPRWIPVATLEDDVTEGAWNYPTVWYNRQDNRWYALYGGAAPHSYFDAVGFFLRTQILLLASSDDGIIWEKADLNGDIKGAKRFRANQVFPVDIPIDSKGEGGPRIDGGPVYCDEQEKDENRHLKYLHRYIDKNGNAEERLAVSPDGVQWKIERLPWGRDQAFHSPSSMFFNKHKNRYVISNWFSLHDRRIVFRETKDLQKLSEPQLIIQADAETPALAETYAMIVFPYEGMYIGLLWLFHPDPREISVNRLFGSIDCYLAYSYHGTTFNKAFHQPFIPHNNLGEHGGSCVFPSSMIYCNNTIRFYSGASKAEMFRNQGLKDAALLLHTLRKDGFVHLESQGRGRIITKCLIFNTDDLNINVCAPYGNVRVQVLDESGRVIEGFGFADSIIFSGDKTDYQPCWQNRRNLSELLGKPLFLEIEIANGSIFAIRGGFDVIGVNGKKYE